MNIFILLGQLILLVTLLFGWALLLVSPPIGSAVAVTIGILVYLFRNFLLAIFATLVDQVLQRKNLFKKVIKWLIYLVITIVILSMVVSSLVYFIY